MLRSSRVVVLLLVSCGKSKHMRILVAQGSCTERVSPHAKLTMTSAIRLMTATNTLIRVWLIDNKSDRMSVDGGRKKWCSHWKQTWIELHTKYYSNCPTWDSILSKQAFEWLDEILVGTRVYPEPCQLQCIPQGLEGAQWRIHKVLVETFNQDIQVKESEDQSSFRSLGHAQPTNVNPPHFTSWSTGWRNDGYVTFCFKEPKPNTKWVKRTERSERTLSCSGNSWRTHEQPSTMNEKYMSLKWNGIQTFEMHYWNGVVVRTALWITLIIMEPVLPYLNALSVHRVTHPAFWEAEVPTAFCWANL